MVVSNGLSSAGNHEAEKIDVEVTRGEREKGDERSDIPVAAIAIVFGSEDHLHPAQFQFVRWEHEQRIEPRGLGGLEVGWRFYSQRRRALVRRLICLSPFREPVVAVAELAPRWLQLANRLACPECRLPWLKDEEGTCDVHNVPGKASDGEANTDAEKGIGEGVNVGDVLLVNGDEVNASRDAGMVIFAAEVSADRAEAVACGDLSSFWSVVQRQWIYGGVCFLLVDC